MKECECFGYGNRVVICRCYLVFFKVNFSDLVKVSVLFLFFLIFLGFFSKIMFIVLFKGEMIVKVMFLFKISWRLSIICF